MGGYLSTPVKTKESSDFVGDKVICGASSMQGWRTSQEDAHNCCVNYDENSSLFAVYDGHGGHEVAEYAAAYLPDYIKEIEAYKAGDYEKALIDAFLGFDAKLVTEEVVEILKKIAASKSDTTKKEEDGDASKASKSVDDDDEDEENLEHLKKEALMPLFELMVKYRQENSGKPAFSSPNLRSRKAGPSTSGSVASSSSDPNGECEVSSSSSNTSSGSGAIDGAIAKTSCEIPNGEVNGEVSNDESGPGSSTKCNGELTAEPVKSNSKEDVVDSSSQAQGDDKKSSDTSGVRIIVTDENGDTVTKSPASSTPDEKKEFPKRTSTLTRKLLCSPDDDSDSDSEDETFQGEESDDDDDDGEECEGENDGEEEDEEDDEEGDSDEEKDDDDDDDEEMEDGPEFPFSEEPGADSGCTAVVALLKGNDLYVANAGDSRCVVCRDGKAIEMSIDHKPEDKIESDRIVAAGGKVTCDGRVNGGLNLSRALGDHKYKQETKLPATEQMITALPDIKKLEIDSVKDEFIVLACDGIWNSMSSQEVVDFIRPKLNDKREKISSICEELFDHCLSPNTMGDGTGCDNMTCIIVKLKQASVNGHESVKRTADSSWTETWLDNGGDQVAAKRPKLDEDSSTTNSSNEPSTVNNTNDSTATTKTNETSVEGATSDK